RTRSKTPRVCCSTTRTPIAPRSSALSAWRWTGFRSRGRADHYGRCRQPRLERLLHGSHADRVGSVATDLRIVGAHEMHLMGADGPGERRDGRAVERHGRGAQRAGEMREAGVDADDEPRVREHAGNLAEP